jgi:hypothetical protein
LTCLRLKIQLHVPVSGIMRVLFAEESEWWLSQIQVTILQQVQTLGLRSGNQLVFVGFISTIVTDRKVEAVPKKSVGEEWPIAVGTLVRGNQMLERSITLCEKKTIRNC